MNKIICSLLIGVMVLCVLWFIVGLVSSLRERKLEQLPKLDAPMPPVKKYQCKHTWKPFPWYHTYSYNSNQRWYKIEIFKPYVCIHCKESKNERLQMITGHASTDAVAEEYEAKYVQKYADKMLPIAIVKEMVADMQLVERKKLEIAEQLGMINKEENDATVD